MLNSRLAFLFLRWFGVGYRYSGCICECETTVDGYSNVDQKSEKSAFRETNCRILLDQILLILQDW